MDKAKGGKGSFWVDHLRDDHGEKRPNTAKIEESFKPDVICSDPDPLRRTLREAIRIKKTIDGEEIEINVDDEAIGDEEHRDDNSRKKTVKVKTQLLNSKREYFTTNLPTGVSLNVQDRL